MQTVLQALNLPCDPQMVEATLAIADYDGNGTLDYSEFVNFVCQARGNKVNSSADGYDEEAQLFETFGLFDKDGDGKLSPSDLMNALSDQVKVLRQLYSICWCCMQFSTLTSFLASYRFCSNTHVLNSSHFYPLTLASYFILDAPACNRVVVA